MSTFFVVVLFLLGILLIVKGGDIFVDAASWMAEVSGIPKLIIGATVVSVATTLPEIIVSLLAAFQGKPDMAIGNAVGSVTVNIGFIMALSIVCMPAVMKRSKLAFKGLLMLLSVLLLYLFSRGGELKVAASLVLLALFLVFIVENVHEAKKSMDSGNTGKTKLNKKELAVNLAKFIFGAAGIVLGAQLLVDNGSTLARILGIPESIISATMIAIGTSLPELVTTVTAIVKKQSALSIGNIIGANIIDLTVILPLCAIVSGGALPISRQGILLDLPVCLGIIAVAILPTLFTQKFSRLQGILLMLVYIAYVVVMCSGIIAF